VTAFEQIEQRKSSALNQRPSALNSIAPQMVDPWLLAHLACPRCKRPLDFNGEWLTCQRGHRYPVIDDIPVMLLDDVEQTHWVATHALEYYREAATDFQPSDETIDPVVQEAIGATCGNLYRHVIGHLPRYPIPQIPFTAPQGTSFLDIGCHWGRWCVSAARNGWRVVGIDPSLNGIRAAKRVARALGVDVALVIGDGRYLPFASSTFQVVHSYSVLQHFAEDDVRRCLREIGRVLEAGGESHIQMAQRMGLLNLWNQARRGFRLARLFQVRYWRLDALRTAFSEDIGPTALSVDGFLSLNAQLADLDLLRPGQRALVQLSHRLRGLSQRQKWLIHAADSVYVNSTKSPGAAENHADGDEDPPSLP
jgi:2-polyprenyl-3-methyl-5-hydroxy-6-metoxy-1,4-benzoquinol methylase